MVKFSEHALRRMRERGISVDEVVSCIEGPDDIFRNTATSRRIIVCYNRRLVVVLRNSIVVTVIRVSNIRNLVRRRNRSGRWKRI